MKQKNRVNQMCGKKAISVRPIYVGGRKQEHVTKGWIFLIASNMRLRNELMPAWMQGLSLVKHVGLP